MQNCCQSCSSPGSVWGGLQERGLTLCFPALLIHSVKNWFYQKKKTTRREPSWRNVPSELRKLTKALNTLLQQLFLESCLWLLPDYFIHCLNSSCTYIRNMSWNNMNIFCPDVFYNLFLIPVICSCKKSNYVYDQQDMEIYFGSYPMSEFFSISSCSIHCTP